MTEQANREKALAQINFAIDYYQTHDWGPNYLGLIDGARCIAGALMIAPKFVQDGKIWRFGALYGEDLNDAARAMDFQDTSRMVTWNNTPGRTKAEIVARLEAGRDKLLTEGVEAGV